MGVNVDLHTGAGRLAEAIGAGGAGGMGSLVEVDNRRRENTK
jgi:hypothetical protein